MISSILRMLFAPHPKVGDVYINSDDDANPFSSRKETITILEVNKGHAKFQYHGWWVREGKIDSNDFAYINVNYKRKYNDLQSSARHD